MLIADRDIDSDLKSQSQDWHPQCFTETVKLNTPVYIHMTVYEDAVKLELADHGRRALLGWFIDEVSAIGAAAEHALMQSAILSSLRQLPELVICAEYKATRTGREIPRFKRATRVKNDSRGRRIVMSPGTWGKTWVNNPW